MTQKEYYQWYKSHRICVRCRTKKAVKNRVCCPTCAKKAREKSLVYSRENAILHKDKRKAYNKERYSQLKAMHICVTCGKRPAKENRIRCEQCLAYGREWRQKKNTATRIQKGEAI